MSNKSWELAVENARGMPDGVSINEETKVSDDEVSYSDYSNV